MKSKSELVELRFCYVLLLLFVTLLFAFGCRKSILGLNILFLPFLRIISLYSTLPKLPKNTFKIIQSILILLAIGAYFFLFVSIKYYTSVRNEVFITIFLCEILLIVIFHRYIFFSKHTFSSKYLYMVYGMLKKYYLDIMLFIFGLKIFYSTSIYNAFTNWTIDISFLGNFEVEIKRWLPLIYMYAIYIIIAGILYAIGIIRIHSKKNKKKDNVSD